MRDKNREGEGERKGGAMTNTILAFMIMVSGAFTLLGSYSWWCMTWGDIAGTWFALLAFLAFYFCTSHLTYRLNTTIKHALMLVVFMLLLTGCALSNDEIIQEAKKCEAAGMDYQALHNISYEIAHVQCVPKKEVCKK